MYFMYFFVFIVSFVISSDSSLQGQELSETSSAMDLIKGSNFDDLVLTHRKISSAMDYNEIRHQLLLKLITYATSDSERITEHLQQALTYQGKTMRYFAAEIGEPEGKEFPIYIALHGGGSVGSWLNDFEWETMKYYYSSSVDNGIYVAVRGITDNWNLHFEDESYHLYARLIENMILFKDANPNQIYILGFSAGGDGVYQIAARMSDRFAGASMSAGHSNSLDLANLRNVPFLMQMGEHDHSFNRNRNAVENLIRLKELQAVHGSYIHDLYLHKGGSHNNWQGNNAQGIFQYILKDPIAWYAAGNSENIKEDTNAVHWLKDRTRNPCPNKIVWNTATTTPCTTVNAISYLDTSEARDQIGSNCRLFYWLDANNNASDKLLGQIVASYCRETNRIDIEAIDKGVNLKILLNETMVDFLQPIDVAVKGEIVARTIVTPSLEVMTRTFLERGDPNYCFQGEIELTGS